MRERFKLDGVEITSPTWSCGDTFVDIFKVGGGRIATLILSNTNLWQILEVVYVKFFEEKRNEIELILATRVGGFYA